MSKKKENLDAANGSEEKQTDVFAPVSESSQEGETPTTEQPVSSPAYLDFPPPTTPPVGYSSELSAAASAMIQPKKKGSVALVAALSVGALIGGASGTGVTFWIVSQNKGTSSNQLAGPSTITVNNPDKASLFTAVAAKASPSVVTLQVSDANAGGEGSGVVLSSDGYVVTNTHVVTLDGQTAAPDIQVTASNGAVYSAKVVGTDPIADLAVIKLVDASGLTPIVFANSSRLNVGDITIAIGAPLGLSGTVTNGIVSSLNRSIQIASSAAPDSGADQPVPEQKNQEKSPFDFWNFDVPDQESDPQQSPQQSQSSSISLAVIQTDAAINPGNSGGALLNSEGELIGINVAIANAGNSSSEQSGSIGVGFAIPSNYVKRVADEIIATGSATHGLLGASISEAPAATASSRSLVGAQIVDITPGGAAQLAGLQKGDIITEFNKTKVANPTDLTAQVRMLPAGARAEVTFVRAGSATTLEVVLGQLAA